MSKSQANINTCKICAFCKYWWDPACKYIAPSNGIHWVYESDVRCHCIQKHVETLATSTCAKYKPKIDLN